MHKHARGQQTTDHSICLQWRGEDLSDGRFVYVLAKSITSHGTRLVPTACKTLTSLSMLTVRTRSACFVRYAVSHRINSLLVYDNPMKISLSPCHSQTRRAYFLSSVFVISVLLHSTWPCFFTFFIFKTFLTLRHVLLAPGLWVTGKIFERNTSIYSRLARKLKMASTSWQPDVSRRNTPTTIVWVE